jgi:ABC-2 type transport system permease protein
MSWWRSVAASELRKIFAYRVDFWVTFIGQVVIQLSIARALWQSIYESSGQDVMKGFTLPMMTLYFLIIPLGNRILQGENMGFLSREIYDGTFSRYLLYPLSFFNYKSVTYLTYSFFYTCQLVLIFVLYQFLFENGLTAAELYHLMLGAGIYLLAAFAFGSLNMVVELFSLWADNVWSLSVMLRFFCYFLGGSYIPIDFFPLSIQRALAYSPFPYMINLPVKTIMGMNSHAEIFQGVALLGLWAVALQVLARIVWKKGQSQYSGVGI